MTSCGDPQSGGVRFGFFVRLGAVDLLGARVAASGDVERGRLSDERAVTVTVTERGKGAHHVVIITSRSAF
jgi:hypothetical protein